MQRLIISIIILAVAVAPGLLLVWPKYQSFQSLQEQVKQKEAEFNSRKEYYSEIRNISDELAKYKEELSRIDFALPEEFSMPYFFYFLQQMTGETGMLLENISSGGPSNQQQAQQQQKQAPQIREVPEIQPQEEKEAKQVQEIGITLRVSGSYSTLKSFLSALEKSARLFSVTGISFSSSGEAKESFSFDINLITHSY